MKLIYDLKASHIQEVDSFIGTNFIPAKFENNTFEISYQNHSIPISVVEDTNIKQITLLLDISTDILVSKKELTNISNKFPNLQNNENEFIQANREIDDLFYLKIKEIALLLQYYLTYEIEKNNSNPHSGNMYFQFNYEDFNMSPISDFLKIQTFQIRHLNLDKTDISSNHEFIMQAYYEGLRTELITSKFFHFFLILEYLENSKLYKNMFATNKTFSDEDIDCMKACVIDKDKKQKISALNRFTDLNRKEKLLKLLQKINIFKYKPLGSQNEMDIDLEVIQEVLKARNEFFHTSNSSITKLEKILWNTLYPIIKKVIDKLLIEKIEFE